MFCQYKLADAPVEPASSSVLQQRRRSEQRSGADAATQHFRSDQPPLHRRPLPAGFQLWLDGTVLQGEVHHVDAYHGHSRHDDGYDAGDDGADCCRCCPDAQRTGKSSALVLAGSEADLPQAFQIQAPAGQPWNLMTNLPPSGARLVPRHRRMKHPTFQQLCAGQRSTAICLQ